MIECFYCENHEDSFNLSLCASLNIFSFCVEGSGIAECIEILEGPEETDEESEEPQESSSSQKGMQLDCKQ